MVLQERLDYTQVEQSIDRLHYPPPMPSAVADAPLNFKVLTLIIVEVQERALTLARSALCNLVASDDPGRYHAVAQLNQIFFQIADADVGEIVLDNSDTHLARVESDVVASWRVFFRRLAIRAITEQAEHHHHQSQQQDERASQSTAPPSPAPPILQQQSDSAFNLADSSTLSTITPSDPQLVVPITV